MPVLQQLRWFTLVIDRSTLAAASHRHSKSGSTGKHSESNFNRMSKTRNWSLKAMPQGPAIAERVLYFQGFEFRFPTEGLIFLFHTFRASAFRVYWSETLGCKVTTDARCSCTWISQKWRLLSDTLKTGDSSRIESAPALRPIGWINSKTAEEITEPASSETHDNTAVRTHLVANCNLLLLTAILDTKQWESATISESGLNRNCYLRIWDFTLPKF